MLKKLTIAICCLCFTTIIFATENENNNSNNDDVTTYSLKGGLKGANSGSLSAACVVKWSFVSPGLQCDINWDNYSNFTWAKVDGNASFDIRVVLNELTFVFNNKANESVNLQVVDSHYDMRFDNLTLVFNDLEYSVKASGAYILNGERFEFPIQNEEPDADGQTESKVLFQTLLF